MSGTLNMAAIAVLWSRLEGIAGNLRPIQTDADLARLSTLLDQLLDETQGDDAHPLCGLVACVGELVAEYEDRVLPPAAGTPAELLALLMHENGLTQTDLASELGGQSVVSQILRGKRQINGRQAARLAARFGLAADAFLGAQDAPGATGNVSAPAGGCPVVLQFNMESTTATQVIQSSAAWRRASSDEPVRLFH